MNHTMHAIDLPITVLRELLDSRKLSSVELAEACIERSKERSNLNVWTYFESDVLLQQARHADERLASGERLPLLGIPIALKDNIEAAGMPCGAGTASLEGIRAQNDAALVTRLRSAGALIAGKVGMHELAFGISSNNAVSGAIRNPWDSSRIPGGSSGGSGAAVGARIVPAAIGTDTGGSVRVPAALCGVTGFRPTVGRVPGAGIAPISLTRDTAGPIAYTVADCALLDAVMSGSSGARESVNLKGLRLGVPRNYFWTNVEPTLKAVAENAVNALASVGVELVELDLPGMSELNGTASFPVALYEFVRDMREYLRVRNCGVTLEQMVSTVASPDVRGAVGTLLSGGGIPEEIYQQALAARKQLQALYAETFGKYCIDALVFPTTPRTAALIGEDEVVALNGEQVPAFGTFIRNTDPGSNASLPGVSIPVGLACGLPVGLALDGPINSDRRLLAIAEAVQAALPPAPQITSPT